MNRDFNHEINKVIWKHASFSGDHHSLQETAKAVLRCPQRYLCIHQFSIEIDKYCRRDMEQLEISLALIFDALYHATNTRYLSILARYTVDEISKALCSREYGFRLVHLRTNILPRELLPFLVAHPEITVYDDVACAMFSTVPLGVLPNLRSIVCGPSSLERLLEGRCIDEISITLKSASDRMLFLGAISKLALPISTLTLFIRSPLALSTIFEALALHAPKLDYFTIDVRFIQHPPPPITDNALDALAQIRSLNTLAWVGRSIPEGASDPAAYRSKSLEWVLFVDDVGKPSHWLGRTELRERATSPFQPGD